MRMLACIVLPVLTAAPGLGAGTPEATPRGSAQARESTARAGTSDEGTPPVFYETTTVTARPVSSATGSVTVVEEGDLAAAAARSGTDLLR